MRRGVSRFERYAGAPAGRLGWTIALVGLGLTALLRIGAYFIVRAVLK